MIEDMGRSSDGTEIKSMYPLCNCNVPHIRKIREISDSDSNTEAKIKPFEEKFRDISSGELPSIIDPFEQADMKVSVPERELSDDYLIPYEKSEPKGKNKREKKPMAEELRLRESLNDPVMPNKINIMSSPEALIQEPPSSFHNHFTHDVSSNRVPPHLSEESVIDPPILLTDGSESPDSIFKYPEYEQVDKHYVPETQSSTVATSFESITVTTSSETINSDYDLQTSGSISSVNVSDFTDDLIVDTSDTTENTILTSNTNVTESTTNVYNELSEVSTYSPKKVTSVIGSNSSDEAEVVSEPVPTASVSTEATFISTATDDLVYGKFVCKNKPPMLGFYAFSIL